MKKIVVLLLALIVLSCNQSAKMEEGNADYATLSRKVSKLDDVASEAPGSEVLVKERMLIKTGNLAMQVDDVKEARKRIGDIAISSKHTFLMNV